MANYGTWGEPKSNYPGYKSPDPREEGVRPTGIAEESVIEESEDVKTINLDIREVSRDHKEIERETPQKTPKGSLSSASFTH